MNWKDLGEMNRATPSATVNTPADLELAHTYLTRCGVGVVEMVLGVES